MNQNSAGKVTDSKPTNTRILFVGKLNAHKGVINLAKAAKNILEKYPSVEFILIGEDWPTEYKFGKVSMSEILKKIVNNDDRFTMTGKINYNELALTTRKRISAFFRAFGKRGDIPAPKP